MSRCLLILQRSRYREGSEERHTANIRKTAGRNARILKGASENLERDLQQIMNVSAQVK